MKGFRVAVADAAIPPIDKACGEGLMPDSQDALRRLGVVPDREESFAFRGIRFHGAGVSVAANFPGQPAIGIRRTRLHQLLMDRAREAGVTMLWGARVNGSDGASVFVDGREVRCRWIVGADGQNSRVRSWSGLGDAQRESVRYGFRRHWQVAPWTDLVEIYWGPGFQVYVTPISAEAVSVALLTRDSHARLDQALAEFPELRRRLRDGAGTERGGITASRRLRNIVRDRTILIGDASGSVDAITGEGLSLAFHQAIALADSLASGDLASYQAEHRRLMRRPTFMAGLLLSLDRFPRLRQPVLKTMAFEPAIFAKLLAVHVGASPPVLVTS
jgi:flavin-dependent dehydrogenase